MHFIILYHVLPADVPEAGVDDDDVRFGVLAKVGQNGLHVRVVAPRHEIEADQMRSRLELTHFPVLDAIYHPPTLTALYQLVVFVVKFSL